MQKRGSFILLFSKLLAFNIRLLLRFRYRILIKGEDVIRTDAPVLYLPNHPAMIDPVILLSEIYRFSAAIPVISENYYDIPVAKWYFRSMGAVRVSDLEKGSRDTNVLQSITRAVYKGLRRNTNILIYPGGQLAAQGYEKILNKKSAYYIVKTIPGNVQIVGVRFTGLWGSMWSKAKTGKSPDFFLQLAKGFFYMLANLIFFVPKRTVCIEFEDITDIAKETVLLGQKTFNTFLEEFYNLHGEEPALFLKHFYYRQ
jgi:long-chain-fatty-acid--[acyl-carrier-protein] ligase